MESTAGRPIRRVLVANRGEIALRVMQACKDLHLRTVAVYAPDEADVPHVRYADDAYRIDTASGIPYLDGTTIIEIARRSGADAIHPGYGFLAENAAFAQQVVEAGLTFIGPSADAIAIMGDKVRARRVASEAGVPGVPGTADSVDSAEAVQSWADEHGYPVAVKAAGGGGGRGFRVARSATDVHEAFTGSSGEADRYFSNPLVYLERYLDEARHIEVQVFADHQGSVVAFPERDCSIQRRHQKLIEESPSPAVDEPLRNALRSAAERLALAVGYVGAGTVEFLVARDGSFYFLEMNTRIQVEHTITEMVTGVDLVREQILVAGGAPLSFGVDDVSARGWALECRINAEDPARGFAPTPGNLSRYVLPTGLGVRVDSGYGEGDSVSPAYDSMIGKLVTWGRSREESVQRMQRALADYEVVGVPTTIGFHANVMTHPAFLAGEATTTFLDRYPEVIPTADAVPDEAERDESEPPSRELAVEVNGRRFDVVVRGSSLGTRSADLSPDENGRRMSKRRGKKASGATGTSADPDAPELTSTVQGTVIRLTVEVGSEVAVGDPICTVEAMKMENEVVAHRAGSVTAVSVSVGSAVKLGDSLVTIEQT